MKVSILCFINLSSGKSPNLTIGRPTLFNHERKKNINFNDYSSENV